MMDELVDLAYDLETRDKAPPKKSSTTYTFTTSHNKYVIVSSGREHTDSISKSVTHLPERYRTGTSKNDLLGIQYL
jgi:hypothetical protein